MGSQLEKNTRYDVLRGTKTGYLDRLYSDTILINRANSTVDYGRMLLDHERVNIDESITNISKNTSLDEPESGHFPAEWRRSSFNRNIYTNY